MNMYVLVFELVEHVYELIRKTIWDEGLAHNEYWLDTPDHLYVIANTFNFCVVLIACLGSTIVLPLYSNMNCTAGMLCIGFISDQQHFIQVPWRHHRDVSVSAWADPYYEDSRSGLGGPCQARGDQLERESHEEYSLDSIAEDDYEGGTTTYNHRCKHWEK
ncbi:hypothetical protein M9H77_34154 [Catharanthus roseus]|uniref:Uncharacterized protein n=1 Tax=Catharanthus roseus TaxID=4058 RepID=A0ACB9ZM35_CATRO|nr:hypothetical protein M9H77_34154 [Catharanthus roseus]